MDRNVQVVTDLNGNKVVMICDVIFSGKRNVNWKEVEQYLRQYVGKFYVIADTKEIVYIGSDLLDEYSNSKYTYQLKGASAKAGEIYLYDILEIKKETSNLFRSEDFTQ